MKSTPPFGGWSRRQQSAPTFMSGMVGRAAAPFYRMPHHHASRMSLPEMPPAFRASKTGFALPQQRRRSPLSLLRSRRHGKDRVLRYIILPAIVILTAAGVFVLLRS